MARAANSSDCGCLFDAGARLADVANLLLDRAAQRTRETGIRLALGASRGAVRQCLAESLILSSIVTVLAGRGN